MLEETDFVDPLPTGLLHVVAALVWNPVKAEPAVNAPESAAGEPTLIVGVCPLFVVVTPSKLHPAMRVLAADALRRLGANINAAPKAQSRIPVIISAT